MLNLVVKDQKEQQWLKLQICTSKRSFSRVSKNIVEYACITNTEIISYAVFGLVYVGVASMEDDEGSEIEMV